MKTSKAKRKATKTKATKAEVAATAAGAEEALLAYQGVSAEYREYGATIELAAASAAFLGAARAYQRTVGTPAPALLPVLTEIPIAAGALLDGYLRPGRASRVSPLDGLQSRLESIAAELEMMAVAPPQLALLHATYLGHALLRIHEATLAVVTAAPRGSV